MAKRLAQDRLRTTNQLLRLHHGDEAAFAELVSDWETPLLFYLRRLVRSEEDAWDLLQETWIKVLRKYHTIKNPDQFSSWVYRIARNTAITKLRKNSPEELLAEEDSFDDLPMEEDPEPEFDEEDVADLYQALDHLSFSHREVITLHFLDDLSLDEIAQLISIPKGTVKSRIYHAKKNLKNIISSKRKKEK